MELALPIAAPQTRTEQEAVPPFFRRRDRQTESEPAGTVAGSIQWELLGHPVPATGPRTASGTLTQRKGLVPPHSHWPGRIVGGRVRPWAGLTPPPRPHPAQIESRTGQTMPSGGSRSDSGCCRHTGRWTSTASGPMRASSLGPSTSPCSCGCPTSGHCVYESALHSPSSRPWPPYAACSVSGACWAWGGRVP